MKPETIYIYGKNAVLEALRKNPKLVERIYLEKGRDFEKEVATELKGIVAENKISEENFSPTSLPREIEGMNHQGIFARVQVESLTINFEYFLKNLEITADTCVVILGELTDVNNVGSIIRSAAALGASGVLIPEHNQAQITGAVVKVSAGAAFSIPLVSIGNVNDTIKKLKDKRFWVYGLDMNGEKNIYQESFTEATCFVVGSESEGLREKTREACDMVLSIPLSGKVESLNAAVSTAIAIYEWRKQINK